MRRAYRIGPLRLAARTHLAASTCHRILNRRGLPSLTSCDRATGEAVRRYERERPGELVHVDVKKLGRIPDGGGHKVVGRADGRTNRARHNGLGYAYLHTALDDHSRLAYTENLPDEKASSNRQAGPPPRRTFPHPRLHTSAPTSCSRTGICLRLKADPVQNTKRPVKSTDTPPNSPASACAASASATAPHTPGWPGCCSGPRSPTPASPSPQRRPHSNPRRASTSPPATNRPPEATLTQRDTLRFSKKKNGATITLATATFDGRLRVTDPEALRRTLLAGLGPSKAYGCGLLTLAPLSEERPDG